MIERPRPARRAVFTPRFLADLKYLTDHDRKLAIRVLDLVEAVLRDPFEGIGKPEPLKYLGPGVWSTTPEPGAPAGLSSARRADRLPASSVSLLTAGPARVRRSLAALGMTGQTIPSKTLVRLGDFGYHLPRATCYPGAPLLPAGSRGSHIVGMPQAANDWTVERVLALPDDGNRYEVVDGELLVTPSPEFHHQDAVLALATILRPHVRANGIGVVSIAPADIELDDRTLVQPDIFVFEPPEGRAPEHWRDVRSTPSGHRGPLAQHRPVRRQLKRRRYQRQGIPEYWILDLDARLLERWRPGDERPEILHRDHRMDAGRRKAHADDRPRGALPRGVRGLSSSRADPLAPPHPPVPAEPALRRKLRERRRIRSHRRQRPLHVRRGRLPHLRRSPARRSAPPFDAKWKANLVTGRPPIASSAPTYTLRCSA